MPRSEIRQAILSELCRSTTFWNKHKHIILIGYKLFLSIISSQKLKFTAIEPSRHRPEFRRDWIPFYSARCKIEFLLVHSLSTFESGDPNSQKVYHAIGCYRWNKARIHSRNKLSRLLIHMRNSISNVPIPSKSTFLLILWSSSSKKWEKPWCHNHWLVAATRHAKAQNTENTCAPLCNQCVTFFSHFPDV